MTERWVPTRTLIVVCGAGTAVWAAAAATSFRYGETGRAALEAAVALACAVWWGWVWTLREARREDGRERE